MTSQDTYSAFMLDHAAGNLPPAMQLAANIHRLMSSQGEDAAMLWELVRHLMTRENASKGQHARDDEQLTMALEVIHTDYGQVRWRRGLSGVRYAKEELNHGQLMRLMPHQSVFSLGHSIFEVTVVLEGALDDGHGTYGEGDILLAEPGMKHKPAAHGNHACTCFVARAQKPFWRLT